MAKRKRPKHETRYQRTLRLIEDGECGLLPMDRQFPCPCPRRDGPERPDPDRPGMVWYRTCSGCRYFADLYLDNRVCTHPKARKVANQWLADAIRRWEEEQAQQSQQAQLTLF